MWTLVNLSFFIFFKNNFRIKSLQTCFTQMWTGATWTSQILVKMKPHQKQDLVGSGPVRRVIPIRRKNHPNHRKKRNHWNHQNQQKKMEKQVTQTQTCFDKHVMNEQVKKPCQRWLWVQRKPEPHKPEGRVQVPGQHRMWTLVNLWFLNSLWFYFRDMSVQLCSIHYKCGQVLCGQIKYL